MPEIPADFLVALESLKGHEFRRELHVTQTPPPTGIAPWAVALQAEVNDSPDLDPDTYRGDSRFVFLYDPAGQPAWNGPSRIVAYTHAPIESEMAGDPLLGEVAWEWLGDSLREAGASFHSMSGTVTRNYNEFFSDEATSQRVEIEMRVSWSPIGTDIGAHITAWAAFAASICGLDPEGITSLPMREI